jgi:hypothetical protein
MVKRAYEKYADLCDIHHYFESEPPQIYSGNNYSSYLTVKQQMGYLQRKDAFSFEAEHGILEYITGKRLNQSNLVLFGAGNAARWYVRRIRHIIDSALSFDIVDNNPEYHGQPLKEPSVINLNVLHVSAYHGSKSLVVKPPDVLAEYGRRNLIIIICIGSHESEGAIEIGQQLLNMGYREGNEFYYLDKLDNSMNLPLSEIARNYYYEDRLK